MGTMKQWNKISLIFLIVFQLVTVDAFSQAAVPKPSSTRKQMATIVFSGLAGAVLGLSTLSFYGRPQDRLSNIAIGFALGIITGSVLVTYGATTNPDEFYGRELSSNYNLIPEYESFSNLQKWNQQEASIQLPVYQYDF